MKKEGKDDSFFEPLWKPKRSNGGACWAAWQKPLRQSRCIAQKMSGHLPSHALIWSSPHPAWLKTGAA